jgi:type III pantothenate kinase
MKLLLDIGNSSVNWVLQEQDEFASGGAFSYQKNNFAQDLQENLSLFVKPSDVLVSNVAGAEIFDTLNKWIKKQWQQELWQPDVSSRFKELKNSYSDSQQMGIDRWLSMVASWQEHQTALCLVGCGTALTIDVIDFGGQHLGGYIVPGIELMQRALISSTEQINVAVNNQASLEYAKDTRAAINNGAFLVAVSMIDHVVDKFSNESKCKPKCIISGGMAELIKPLLNYAFEYEPNLVLTGLSVLHEASQ